MYKIIKDLFTCLDETSYSSSQPLRAFSNAEIFLYLLLSSDKGSSLEIWVRKKNENGEGSTTEVKEILKQWWENKYRS